MPTPSEYVYEALLAWHGDQLDRGVEPERLPKLTDLRTIAETPGINRQVLSEMPLVDRAGLMPYATGVLTAVRGALRELALAPAAHEAAPEPAAATPVPEAAAVPPVRPTRRRTTATTRTTGANGARVAPDPEVARTAAAAPTPASTGEVGFVRYDLAGARASGPPLAAGLKPQADGRLWIGWQPPPGHEVGSLLYRVVSRDDVMPWSPDDAEPIGVTTDTELYDSRPLPDALRHVQVWVHAGPDEAAARASQPVLHRASTLIAPPGDLEWIEDHGTVIISWRPVPGADEVELRRVPLEEVAADVYSSQSVLLRGAGRTTFQDTTCVPGQGYEYQLFSVLVDASGAEQVSEAARFRVQVSTSLAPVPELRLTEHAQGGLTFVDLEWDHPVNAEVQIYRTQQPPAVDVRLQDVDLSALPTAGLVDGDRQRQEAVVVDGLGRMSGVGWPADFARVHFTAVSVNGRTARVGATATRTRTTALTDQRLVQRVSWQLLTFSWPLGAVSVDVHTSTPGTGPEAASGPPDRTLLEAEYRRDGGTRLQLPWGGCEVHLVPVSFYDRRPVRAEAASLHYPGLLTLRYRFVRAQPAPAEPPARRWRSAPPPTPAGPALSYLELMHVTDGRGGGGPLQVPVSLTMTTHSQRLPLSVPDAENRLGTNVVVLGTDRSSGWVPVGGPMDLSRYAGHYVRVFASIEGPPGMEVALLDPSLDALRAR